MDNFPVIDKEEAMCQVDDDEEFLIELLEDFSNKLIVEMRNIEGVINVSASQVLFAKN